MFIEWQILQNQGWMDALTGWPSPPAFGWMMLANVGALAAAVFALGRGWPRSPWWPLLPGAVLTLALAAAEVPGWPFALVELAGLVSAGLLLTFIIASARRSSARSLSLSFGLALLSLVGLTVLYYLSFLVRLLPFPRFLLAPLVGAGLTVCALAAARRREPAAVGPVPDWMPVRLGALLLLAPAALWAAELTAAPPPPPETAASVRVMSYNIRSAFGMNGRLDPAAIAGVIEGEGTQVVCLQELSRGWLITGGADLPPLITQRLRLPNVVMGPATNPLFGNAIASRYRILASGHGPLPTLDALVGRGYVWAQLDWAGGEPLLIMGTHLDSDRSDVRLAQMAALLQAWAGRPRTVLLGDFNALPGSAEIALVTAAGFVDSWAESGQPDRPRIDYIFHTPDLAAHDAVFVESQASDHPAFAVTIAPTP